MPKWLFAKLGGKVETPNPTPYGSQRNSINSWGERSWSNSNGYKNSFSDGSSGSYIFLEKTPSILWMKNDNLKNNEFHALGDQFNDKAKIRTDSEELSESINQGSDIHQYELQTIEEGRIFTAERGYRPPNLVDIPEKYQQIIEGISRL